jgi:hypothetical protein
MGKSIKKCKLCKVKRTIWDSEKFFGINCRKHFVPIIVLKEHKDEITENEKQELKNLIKQYHPNLFPIIEDECPTDHYNVHLTKKKTKK